ncbi:hypothetical protein SPI_03436 [Niveomyces insectorum RCEF 264]|uniref:Uncharacterized protein n=1 Tax=Niveomyces insectorum RCEF 264 TaxID=1081102 RepID=A0A167W2Z2_9HYPO|nr:hypothetical protein SPI_03436 [Niveomyces insectorum RCEF 264]
MPPGKNTQTKTDIDFDDWQPWEDFSYSVLTSIFSRQLRQIYAGDREPMALNQDLELFHEDSLEDVLRRFVSPVVNFALRGQPGAFHLGRGSRCQEDGVPDWSLVSYTCLESDTGTYLNILPGDTKLSTKWWPTIIADNYTEWRNVILQIVYYMTANSSRYGFIITDTCFVALRLTRSDIGPGIAADLPTRTATAGPSGHRSQPSDTSMLSTTSYGSSYSDNDPVKWAYHGPEYAVVPWSAHGAHKLTVKLALWCLAMMAVNDNHIDYWYPDLDSWRSAKHGFVHNTSGEKKRTLSKGDKLQDSPSEPSGHTPASSSSYSYEPDEGSRASSSSVAEYAYYYETGESSGTSDAASNIAGYAGGSGTASVALTQGYSLPVRGAGQSGSYEIVDAAQSGVAPSDTRQQTGQASSVAGQFDSEYGGEEDDDDDADTEVGLSSKEKNRMSVEIKKHRIVGGYYFKDANGYNRDTKREKWHKVDGVYEYEGRKYVYFTKSFP